MLYIGCLGIVWIIKDSYILMAPRNYLKSKSNLLKELLSCSLCLGFWFGLLFAFIDYTSNADIINLICTPFAVSGFCWFMDSLLDLIQEVTVSFKNKRENNME